MKSTRMWQMERGASKGYELCVFGQLKAADARVSAVVLAYMTVYVLHTCIYVPISNGVKSSTQCMYVHVRRSKCCCKAAKFRPVAYMYSVCVWILSGVESFM